MRQTKLSNEHLSEVVSKAGLTSCTDWHRMIFNSRRAATLCEAIIGAVYLDSGRDLTAVRRVMVSLGFREVLDEPDDSAEQQTLVQDPIAEICDTFAEHTVSNSEEDDLESAPVDQA